MLSRDLKDSEKEGHDFKEYVIGRDGIALIVHPTNTVTELTLSQVKDIYQGTITNWKEVGGSDSEIVLVGRDSASGTRALLSMWTTPLKHSPSMELLLQLLRSLTEPIPSTARF